MTTRSLTDQEIGHRAHRIGRIDELETRARVDEILNRRPAVGLALA